MSRRAWIVLTIVLGAAAVLPVTVAPAQESESGAAAKTALNEEYRLVIGDRIRVIVEGHPDLEHPFTVPPDGEISFPPIGKIQLLNKAMSELEREVEEGLREREQFKNPRVYVLLEAYAPRKVYLVGAATGTVELPPQEELSIVQILSEAGVTSDVADFRNVKIIRKRRDGERYAIKVNVVDIIEKDEFKKNILVKAGDIINVPAFASITQTAYVYVLGRVNSPGRYGFIQGREVLTFTKVLALAGDFHQFASQSDVKILRKEHDRTRIITVDFNQIIENEIEDPELMPDDIIYVSESFF